MQKQPRGEKAYLWSYIQSVYGTSLFIIFGIVTAFMHLDG